MMLCHPLKSSAKGWGKSTVDKSRKCLCRKCGDSGCPRNPHFVMPDPEPQKKRNYITKREIERAMVEHKIGDERFGQYTWYAFTVGCEWYHLHTWHHGTEYYCLRNGPRKHDWDLPKCTWNVCPKLKEIRKEIKQMKGDQNA